MAKIIVLCGLPGSGKSHYAHTQVSGNTIHLSSDEIRERIFGNVASQRYNGFVFSIMRLMVEKAIQSNCDVLVDSTNIQAKHRKPWIDIAVRMGAQVVCVFVNPTLEECIKRNELRDRNVPRDVIEKMHDKLEPPTEKEGFHVIVMHH